MLGRSLYVFSAKLVGYAFRLALPIALVRLLTKAEFGSYRQFFLIETMMAMIFQIGMNQALFYFVPRDRKNAGSYYLTSILLNITIFVLAFTVLYFLRQPVSEHMKMPVLTEQFWQVAVYTTMLMLIVATDCYLLSQQKIRQSAFFEIGGQLLTSVVTLAAAFSTRRLEVILGTIALARTGQMLIMVSYVHWGLRGFASSRYFIDIWPQVRYGLVLGLGGGVFSIVLRMPELFVSSRFGPETYAVYSAGCTQIPFLQFYLYSISAVSLGRFAEMVKAGDSEGIRKLWHEVMVGLFGVAVPFTTFLLLVAHPLIILMFTPQYAEAVGIFRVNALMRFVLVWNSSLVLRAMGRNDILLYINLAAMALMVPFLLTGMHFLGLIGAITAGFLVVLLVRITGLMILNRISGLRLEYVPRPGPVFAFYRHAWMRGLELRSKFGLGGRRTQQAADAQSLGKKGP
jgi:O-antigen/teichoic acid export membrane protein